MKNREEMGTPDEKFEAVTYYKDKLEDNFINLGQVLSAIKREKLFLRKGYDSFKDFMEKEHNIGALAGKLCSIYDLYVDELNIDEGSLKQIGFDRLNIIKPIIKDSNYEAVGYWIDKADNLPAQELKSAVKEFRNKDKDTSKTVKEVLVDQFHEKMTTFFNCSVKELSFKLALYFQDANLEAVKTLIRKRQRDFEAGINGEE